jgi:hypothetical protein
MFAGSFSVLYRFKSDSTRDEVMIELHPVILVFIYNMFFGMCNA